MNPENAWNYTLDMLADSPLGQAAACKAVQHEAENPTFFILAPSILNIQEKEQKR